MKFNFEKHTPQEENIEPEVEMSDVEKQEKFEEECMVEADRLEVGLKELQDSIDQFENKEELQAYLERQSLDREEEGKAADVMTRNGLGLGAAAGLFVTSFGAMALGSKFGMGDGAFAQGVYETAVENGAYVSKTVHAIANNPELLAAAFVAVPTAIGGFIGKIKERITRRKLAREQDIDNLTGKMAGVE